MSAPLALQRWWIRSRLTMGGWAARRGPHADRGAIASTMQSGRLVRPEVDPPRMGEIVGPLGGIPRGPHALQAADAGAAAAPTVDSPLSSLAAVLSAHILRDGETVLLVLRPSIWFILFNSAFVSVLAVFVCIVLTLIDIHARDRLYYDAAIFIIASRLMLAILQWMGRLYVLTDMRVVRLSGVFTIDIFDCPLRKVVRTRMVSPPLEKAVGVGSIEIIPRDESTVAAIWQTVARPQQVRAELVAAIKRANQSGLICD